MVRVARPGARVVINDPDWDTLVIDATDRMLTRQIVMFRCDLQRNGWMGRQLAPLALQCGLVEVRSHAFTVILQDWPLANRVYDLEASAERAARAGVISSAQAAEWIRDLVERAEAGRFFNAITGFFMSGHKPRVSNMRQ